MSLVLVDSTEGALAVRDGLTARAQAGETAAFTALLEPRLPGLLRFAAAVLGNEADARDTVQHACVQAWRELSQLRDLDRFDAWLGRILTNACRLTLRSRKRRHLREIPVADLATPVDSQRRAPHGDEQAQGVVDRDALSRAFDRLDPDARILLVEHHLEGLTIPQIAARSGMTQSTVKWRLHIARAALERELEAESR